MIKNRYNQLLSRYKQAEVYMNNPKVSNTQKEAYLPELRKITEKLGILLNSIKEYTEEEALNGFAYIEQEKVG